MVILMIEELDSLSGLLHLDQDNHLRLEHQGKRCFAGGHLVHSLIQPWTYGISVAQLPFAGVAASRRPRCS